MELTKLPRTARDAKAVGGRFYYTGVPCLRGHISERQASDATCVECKRQKNRDNREYHRKYYRANADKIRKRSLANYEKYKAEDSDFVKKRYDRERETQAEYRRRNKRKRAARRRENYQANRRDRLAYTKRYRSENKQRILAYNKKHYAERKDYYFAQAAFRRAAKLQRTPAWLTNSQKAQIAAIYAERRRLSELTGIEFHVDHVIPLRGATVSGLHVPENLDIVPAYVNLSKNNKYEGEGA